MPTPSERGQEPDNEPIEPIRVLRPRRTDALAELMKDMPRRHTGFESITLSGRSPASEGATEELPPVKDAHAASAARHVPVDRVPGLRRTVLAAALTVAAVIGFGCALLLSGRGDARADDTPVQPAPTSAAASAPPSRAATGDVDPDGAGTLREGDSGPEVTDLQERLLRIPDVYSHGSTDGTYDATLRAAVARFQLWYGIRGDEDGVYGDDTRRDLESRTGGG
ncbi:peptidoglycan-binding domain-containing protein [Streptomyces sp. NPDC047072]|uniref:peptidoglycan-binding domain-containing protein n=1 Tax=Streptomyces sp. NPDC047072 TaxID=3154809 RepID=UPI0034019517